VSDPFVEVSTNWLIGRVAPDCCRIELEPVPKTGDELTLLAAMGWEAANIHLGNKIARQISQDLNL
jgi:hypothetical protein